jgi:hypothetical protein
MSIGPKSWASISAAQNSWSLSCYSAKNRPELRFWASHLNDNNLTFFNANNLKSDNNEKISRFLLTFVIIVLKINLRVKSRLKINVEFSEINIFWENCSHLLKMTWALAISWVARIPQIFCGSQKNIKKKHEINTND